MERADKDYKDIWSGLLFVAFGGAGILIALWEGYDIGSARRMGPGFFPVWIGVILAVLGAILAGRGFFRKGIPIDGWARTPALLVTAGTVLFAAIVNSAGLFPATFLLVMVTTYASSQFRWLPSLVLAFALAGFCTLVFIVALGVPLPIMPHVLGR